MTQALLDSTVIRTPVDGQWVMQAVLVPLTPQGVDLSMVVSQHTAWAQIPPVPPYNALLFEVQKLTGWSFRDIAEILGTSHTTVGKLANGALPTTRSQETADRIEPLVDVLARLAALAGSGQALVAILDSPSACATPRDALRGGDWSQAYLAGLDAINGPRPRRPKVRHEQSGPSATRELR